MSHQIIFHCLQHGWHSLQVNYLQMLSCGICITYIINIITLHLHIPARKTLRHFNHLLQGGWNCQIAFKRINLFVITGEISLSFNIVVPLWHLSAISAQWHSTASYLKNHISLKGISTDSWYVCVLSAENGMQSIMQIIKSVKCAPY